MTKVPLGDIGYIFHKEFGTQGWFTGTVIKIMEDGDRQCVYNDGDVEDLDLNELIQLAKLDPNNHHSVNNTTSTTISNKSNRRPRGKSPSSSTIAKKRRRQCGHEGCTKRKNKRCSSMGCANSSVKGGVCVTHGAKVKRCSLYL